MGIACVGEGRPRLGSPTSGKPCQHFLTLWGLRISNSFSIAGQDDSENIDRVLYPCATWKLPPGHPLITMSGPTEDKAVIEFAENVEPGKPSVDYGDGHILVDNDGQVQRLPVPSKDPNDPLNYTRWEKTGIIVSCCWFCK